MITVERLLDAVRRRSTTVTHLTKHDGGWCVATPGQCARCQSTARKGWYYCSGCAAELGRR
jgi:hypothetical protein